MISHLDIVKIKTLSVCPLVVCLLGSFPLASGRLSCGCLPIGHVSFGVHSLGVRSRGASFLGVRSLGVRSLGIYSLHVCSVHVCSVHVCSLGIFSLGVRSLTIRLFGCSSTRSLCVSPLVRHLLNLGLVCLNEFCRFLWGAKRVPQYLQQEGPQNIDNNIITRLLTGCTSVKRHLTSSSTTNQMTSLRRKFPKLNMSRYADDDHLHHNYITTC